MSRRIFIAINPIPGIRKKLYRLQDECPDLPVKWTSKENLHITVSFLGEVEDRNLSRIIENTKTTAKKHTPFFITLDKVEYGPPGKHPRMVWVTGEKSEKLGALRADLEKELFNFQHKRVSKFKKKGYAPHVTLGRLRKRFNRLRPGERPEIGRDIFIKFEVISIDIIESELEKSGAKYTKLQTVSLRKF